MLWHYSHPIEGTCNEEFKHVYVYMYSCIRVWMRDSDGSLGAIVKLTTLCSSCVLVNIWDLCVSTIYPSPLIQVMIKKRSSSLWGLSSSLSSIIIIVRIVDCQASSAFAAITLRTTTFWHLLTCLNVGSSFVWWWWCWWWWWRWWCEQCLRLCAIIIHPQFCHGQVCTAMEYTHKTLVMMMMMMMIVMTQWFWLSAKALPIKLRGSCKINCRTDTKLRCFD